MSASVAQRREAFATPWPYIGVALLSALASPFTFSLTLFSGVIVGTVGSLRGALSREERGRVQGVHILFVGLSLLVGPLAYIILGLGFATTT